MATVTPRRDSSGNIISYSISVYRGRDASGKKLYWNTTFKVKSSWQETTAKKKADEYAAVFEEKCKSGLVSNDRRRFDEYCDYVISLKESRGAKHKTIAGYRDLTKRIYPEIGHIKVKDLRVEDLNRFYTKLSQTPIKSLSYKAAVDLSSLLKEKHMTRAGIAREAGLAESTVSLAIRGESCSQETAKKISQVLGDHVDNLFYTTNDDRCLSSKTITEYHRLISTVLHQAAKEGLVTVNVAANADPPKISQKEIESLQTDELRAILIALENESLKWKTLVYLLFITGGRRGEVIGLRFCDIDCENLRIRIRNNVLYSRDVGIYQDTPKTKKSERFIPVPQGIIDIVLAWEKQVKSELGDEDLDLMHSDRLLFTQANGSPMHPDSVTTWLDRFAKKKNLPHINPHKFRHTLASLLIANHVDLVVTSRLLGHSRTSTTLDVYSHVIEEAEKQNVEIMQEVFSKNVPKK